MDGFCYQRALVLGRRNALRPYLVAGLFIVSDIFDNRRGAMCRMIKLFIIFARYNKKYEYFTFLPYKINLACNIADIANA